MDDDFQTLPYQPVLSPRPELGDDLPTIVPDEKRTRHLVCGEVLLGRYRILEEIGQGGMGVVYKCLDQTGGVELALKALPPEISWNESVIRELRENFRLAGRLVHQNIASYRQLECDGVHGDWFLLMEYVQGETLSSWQKSHGKKNGGVPLEQAVPILCQVADALDYAHDKNVLHRDIKPSNIMVNAEGEVKVLDFGLATRIDPSLSCSQTIQGKGGTLGYMAPEQEAGERQTAATDEYSLAVVAFEMLSGRRYMDVLRESLMQQRPMEIPGLPDHVWQVLRRGMSEKPEKRFECCRDFVKALAGHSNSKSQGSFTRMSDSRFNNDNAGQREVRVESSDLIRLSIYLGVCFILCAVFFLGQGRHGGVFLFGVILGGGLISLAWWRRIKEKKTISLRVSSTDDEMTVGLPGGSECVFLKVKAGSFQMGSPVSEAEHNEAELLHTVTLTQDYWLGKLEVTQEQWSAVMGINPSDSRGLRLPVEKVSWNDAQEFCRRINRLYDGLLPGGYRFSLPTEAQWEYACRAGTTTAYSFGEACNGNQANCNGNHPCGNTSRGPYLGKTSEVGSYAPNAWGFYDMHGNVWEWCQDWYYAYSSDEQKDPKGVASGSARVLRGGSWYGNAGYCRSANRNYLSPNTRVNNIGLRLAILPPA